MSSEIAKSNSDQFAEHLESVDAGTNAGVRIEEPVDAKLFDNVAVAACQEKELDVEPPPDNCLLSEKIESSSPPERFETTLGIVNAGNGHELNESIEHPSHDVTVPRLFEPACAVRLARPGNHVGTFDDLHKGFQALGRHRKVRVAQEYDISARGQRSGPRGKALASLLELEQTNRLGLGLKPANSTGGAVSAPVRDDDDLPRIVLPAQILSKATNRAGKTPRLVVGRDHDRQRDGLGIAIGTGYECCLSGRIVPDCSERPLYNH